MTIASKRSRSSCALDVRADVDAVAQLDALVGELLHAALDDPLLDLEIGDAEAHEPAGGLVALEEDDAVTGAAQLLRGRHARGPGADHRDGLRPSRGAAAAA